MNAEFNDQPWWKLWHMWLIVAGPLAVVIASFITLYLAIVNPDDVVEGYYRRDVVVNIENNDDTRDGLAPAVRARNHAATGVETPSD
ncbi:MAG: FixH family protein [Methylophilaceae bacterium]